MVTAGVRRFENRASESPPSLNISHSYSSVTGFARSFSHARRTVEIALSRLSSATDISMFFPVLTWLRVEKLKLRRLLSIAFPWGSRIFSLRVTSTLALNKSSSLDIEAAQLNVFILVFMPPGRKNRFYVFNQPSNESSHDVNEEHPE